MGEKATKFKSVKVAGNDISAFTVVCDASSGSTAERAATDLVKYIKQTAGVELPLQVCDGSVPEALSGKDSRVICVGKTPFDTEKSLAAVKDLKNNGYAIVADGGNLFLTGATPTGAMYAVYSFLEDIVGWRFYSSTFELLKDRSPLDVPEGFTKTFSPKLFSRDTFWFDTFDETFAAKLKLNGCVNRDNNNYGEMVRYAGRFVHSLPALAGTSYEPDVQPCLTDPAVYEKVLEGVRSWLRDNPEAKIVSVSQNDSYADGRGCQCENCRKLDEEEGTPMGSLLTFVNRIAGDIKDEFPDVMVDTLAYRYTRKAPKHLKPADNVIIRLCSIECCFSHPLSYGCERNREFAADLEAWSKICKNLFIWDYTTDFLYYVNPFPNLSVLYDDIRFYVAHNAIGLFEQGNGQSLSGEFGELRAYLIAHLEWNPDMTREEYFALMDDFLEGYYGAGWKHIRRYIDLTTSLAERGHMGIYYSVDKILGIEGEKGKELLLRLQELWTAAYNEADELHRPNVERSSLQVEYALVAACEWQFPESLDRFEALHKHMRDLGITFYREGAPLPEKADYWSAK